MHDVLLTVNGFAQAALVVAWVVLRRRIRARADGSEVTFTAAQYSLSLQPPKKYALRGRLRAQRAPQAACAGGHTDSRRPARARRRMAHSGGVAHLSAEEYDLLEWHHGCAYCVAGMAVGLALSLVLGTDVPLLLHTALASLQLVRHPLVNVHLRRQPVVRPWNSFNPFL